MSFISFSTSACVHYSWRGNLFMYIDQKTLNFFLLLSLSFPPFPISICANLSLIIYSGLADFLEWNYQSRVCAPALSRGEMILN